MISEKYNEVNKKLNTSENNLKAKIHELEYSENQVRSLNKKVGELTDSLKKAKENYEG